MSSSDSSFYVTGGTLRHDAPSYVERQADRDLLDGLLAGDFCYVLTSRQMGKSSLMVRTTNKLREQAVNVAVLDLTAIGQNVTPEQWYDGLLMRMGRQLELEEPWEDYWAARRILSPVQRFISAIHDVILPARPGPLVVFVDEIDTVRSLRFSTDEFFAAIRECHNRRAEDVESHRLTFCLLGVATPSDLIRDTRLTPFNVGRRIVLNDFTEPEARALGKGLSSDTARGGLLLKRILHWTAGHPYLTQRLCQAVAADAEAAVPSRVDLICGKLFLANRAREQDDNLLFVRERLLRSEVDLAGLLSLYERVHRGKQCIRDEETNPLVSVLRLSGIVRVEAGALAVRNRIYQRAFDREWIGANMPDADLRRQRAAFRRGFFRAAALAAVVVVSLSLLVLRIRHERDLGNAVRVQMQLQHAEELFRSGQARNGLAYLASALRENPANQNIARRLVSALSHRDFALPIAGPLPHTAAVQAARFSPDSSLVATVCADDSARVWQVQTGTPITPQLRHASRINTVQFSPDGRMLLTACSDGTARVWDVTNGGALWKEFKPASAVYDARFSSNGQQVVTASAGSALQSWDLYSGRLVSEPLKEASNGLAARLSPHGDKVAVVMSNGAVRLWTSDNASSVAVLDGTNGYITSLDFSPDGEWLAAGRADKLGQVWQVRTGNRLSPELRQEGPVSSVRFSPDGQRVLTASLDGTAQIWETRTGEAAIPRLRHGGMLYVAEFSQNAERVVTASSDGTARIWDARTGQPIGESLPHSDQVYSAEFSPDSQFLVTGSADSTARIWDVRVGRLLPLPLPSDDGRPIPTLGSTRRLTGGRFVDSEDNIRVTERLNAIVILKDRKQAKREGLSGVSGLHSSGPAFTRAKDFEILVLPYLGKPVTLGSLKRLQREIIAFGQSKGMVSIEAWVPNQDVIDGIVQMAVVENLAKDLPADMDGNPTGEVGDLWMRVVPPDASPVIRPQDLGKLRIARFGKYASTILVAGGRTARVWNSQSGQPLIDGPTHSRDINSIDFSGDGQRIATASADGVAYIWEAGTGAKLASFTRHSGPIVCIRFSPDGLRVISASLDMTASVWDSRTGTRLQTIKLPPSVYDAEFSPNGRRAVIASADNAAFLWDFTNAPIRLAHEKQVHSGRFSPKGDRIITASLDGTARVWDATTGRPLLPPFQHAGWVYAAEFSPDGTRIVTACADKAARVWNAFTGKLVTESLRHDGVVFSARFSPDSRRVVTASHDKTMRIWDAGTGLALGEALVHAQAVHHAEFSPEGTRVLAVSASDGAFIWDLNDIASDAPAWLPRLAETVAQLRVGERGGLEPVSAAELNSLKKQLAKDSAASGYARWSNWFLDDRSTRAIAPGWSIPVPEYVRRRIDQDSLESLREAMLLCPTNALALARLARRLAETHSVESVQNAQVDWLIGRALSLAPESQAIWLVQADVLEMRADWEGALHLLGKAIARIVADGSSTTTAVGDLRARRARLLRKLNRGPEISAEDNLAFLGLPPRNSKTPPELIDLSTHYNAALTNNWRGGRAGNDLASLPRGVQKFGDVEFDVRGLIQLSDTALRNRGLGFPKSTTNILIGLNCRRLHFLHSASGVSAEGNGRTVADFVIHYADGTQVEAPIVDGRDLLEWWAPPNQPPPSPGPLIAWTGTNAASLAAQRVVRLFRMTWDNPFPGRTVRSLDYVNRRSDTAPFLIAITAEPPMEQVR